MAFFLDNFEVLADAPNGIKHLREMILQLAVMGKLVPQEPDDEPASLLLEKIKKEKEQLIKAGKIKNQKSLPPIKEEEIPYQLPKGWEWVRLGEIGQIIGGGTPKTGNPDYFSVNGISWLTPADLYSLKDKYISKGRRDISPLGLQKSSAQLMPAGTVLFSSRAPIGYVAIAKNELATNQGFKSCATYIQEINQYLYYYLKYSADEIDANATGTTFKEVSGKIFSLIFVPLPPLNEQNRIVERVDQLMALCDELEKNKEKQNKKQVTLNNASLEKLLSADSPEEFQNHWRRIAVNFDLLYSNPENVAKLKQAILQLAVMGKLVPQDPDDEPASLLLEKIKKEKEQLIKDGKIKKQKPLPPISDDEKPYLLPKGWEWIRLGSISKTIEYGTSCKSLPGSDGVPILRMNNIQNGKIIFDNLKFISPNIKDLPRLFLTRKDLLFNRTNSFELVGKTGVFTGEDNQYTFASYLIRAILFMDYIEPFFINMAMNSTYYRTTQIEPEITQQCGQANFNGTKLSNTLVPIAPVNEQHRIVARVEELLTLCDGLEETLRKAETKSERLCKASAKSLAF